MPGNAGSYIEHTVTADAALFEELHAFAHMVPGLKNHHDPVAAASLYEGTRWTASVHDHEAGVGVTNPRAYDPRHVLLACSQDNKTESGTACTWHDVAV